MLFYSLYRSPLGEVTMASDESEALCGLWLEGQKYFAAKMPEDSVRDDNRPAFIQGKYWLDAYFAGQYPLPDMPKLAPQGTDFQKSVWKQLLKIPYGETCSYGSLAAAIASARGYPASARAVGQAVGHNPVSIIIPCHRVVGANGSITGYAGGIGRKKTLLALEANTKVKNKI